MDRASTFWPGGPVPPARYPHEPLGNKYPPHTVGEHLIEVQKKLLCRADDTQNASQNGNAIIEMTVPDSRLLPSLAVVFVPDDCSLDPQWPFPLATIHLAATMDFGFGYLPVEDLIGTRAAPAPIVSLGLWGMQYSPTEEVEGLRAKCVLSYNDGYKVGAWYAVARWQALRPMTQIEWARAVALCQFNATCDKAHISYGPGG